MRHPTSRAIAILLAVIALAAGGCAASPTATPIGSVPTPEITASPSPSEAASDVASPPAPTPVSTTQTAWGAIVDAVPDSFPVYPGAQIADPPAEPVSAAYLSSDGVDAIAAWYRTTLESLGFSTMSLSSVLEDGSRVLDIQGDLPECRIQETFRPEGGSTMITVLYGAGCAGGQG